MLKTNYKENAHIPKYMYIEYHQYVLPKRDVGRQMGNKRK